MPSRPPGYTIFEDGKLKSGLCQIQNPVNKTYLDIHEYSVADVEKNDGISLYHLLFHLL